MHLEVVCHPPLKHHEEEEEVSGERAEQTLSVKSIKVKSCKVIVRKGSES